MRQRVLAACSLLATATAFAQSPPDPNYVRQEIFPSYSAFRSELNAVAASGSAVQLDDFWNTLLAAGQVPYAQGSQYAFLYRGNVNAMSARGEFNGWGQSPGINFPGTNLWIVEGSLPANGRVDYKLFLNNSQWVLDPANPLQMWSGLGIPNSELRMPDYVYPTETIPNAQVAPGTLTSNISVQSSNLGYNVNYRVYTPAGYAAENLAELPTVYVTDGHEYLADHLGSMVTTLDNLIDAGRLAPTMAVFIDPRDPNSGFNRRQQEYATNPNFAAFVADELVPTIDAAYRTDTSAEGRTILGTSLGGLNAAYFGAVRPDVFANIAPQSPAFWFRPEIYTMYQNGSPDGLEIFMTAGTVNDNSSALNMESILAAEGYDYTYLETNEGHSWGNWRALVAEMLINLIGPPTVHGDYNADGTVTAADYTLWRDTLGSTTDLRADGNGNNRVDEDDYAMWHAQFGATTPGWGAPAGASSAPVVPEPSALLLTVMAIAGIGHAVRR